MEEKAILQKMIIDSLDTLYTNDHYLIWNRRSGSENHVGERALMFRFGIYFDMFAQMRFPKYHVDSEYNRNMDNPKVLPSWGHGCYPDLILHQRGKNSRNLLVIEAKTWWSPDQTEDRLKIKQFCDPRGEYQYKYGALIFIGKMRTSARIRFYTAGVEEILCLDTVNPTTKTPSSSSFKRN